MRKTTSSPLIAFFGAEILPEKGHLSINDQVHAGADRGDMNRSEEIVAATVLTNPLVRLQCGHQRPIFKKTSFSNLKLEGAVHLSQRGIFITSIFYQLNAKATSVY